MTVDESAARLRRRALLAAVVLGVSGFGALELYERRLIRDIGGGAPVGVLVAAQDLARGTEVKKDILGVRTIPERYVEPRHVREASLDRVLGGTTAVALKAGETLAWTDLEEARFRARRVSELVEPGSRALTVARRSPDNVLRPGDRVDVLDRRGTSLVPTLQDLVVLAVGGDTGEGASSSSGQDSVTLAGSPDEIAELARVSAGSVVLSLRNPSDGRKLAVATDGEDRGPATNALAAPRSIEHVQ